MRNFILFMAFMLAASVCYAQLPVTHGLITHLDETSIVVDESNYVSRWDDLSGNGADALPVGGAGTAPTMVAATINDTSHNVVLFDGINDYLQFDNISAYDDLSAITVFLVARAAVLSPTGDHALFFTNSSTHANVYAVGQYKGTIQAKSRNDAGSQIAVSAGPYSDSYWISCSSRVNDIISSWYNSIAVATRGGAVKPFGKHNYSRLASITNVSPGYYANCEMAELIVYGSELSDADRNAVIHYLSQKYNIKEGCYSGLAGDIDDDCEVTFNDLMMFAQNWLVSTSPGSDSLPVFGEKTIFANTDYFFFRIPSIVVAADGTVLAFCNRRVGSIADNSPSDLVLRRSVDGGVSWKEMQILSSLDGWSSSIGSAILDENNGKIMVIYGRYPKTEEAIERNLTEKLPTGRFIACSEDNGVKWVHNRFDIAPNNLGKIGSCHGSSPGITLQYGQHKGRLVMPARFTPSEQGLSGNELYEMLQTQSYNCAIYSDNHGLTWQTSEPVQVGTGEGCLAEMSDGTIYYNSRVYFKDYKRRIAYSNDAAETFGEFRNDNILLEPVFGCNAALVQYHLQSEEGKNIFIFSNPANLVSPRSEMTIRISYDDGFTWPVDRILHKDFAAYSALATNRNGMIYCLYECGESSYEEIRIVRFNMEWIRKR